MKEKLYTIPVTDAFKGMCECPICQMKQQLSKDAIDFTMGPSYMEDDIRAETDHIGFCPTHIHKLYENQNRLGLALMLSTHLKKSVSELEIRSKQKPSAKGLFKKTSECSSVKSYIDELSNSCFICDRIHRTFDRYIVTIFYLYKTEAEFRSLFLNSKGFCTTHYGTLFDAAPTHLSGKQLEQFIEDLNSVYFDNMHRIQEELEWFIDKFDYRNATAPWKNSQDALPRTILKVNSEFIE